MPHSYRREIWSRAVQDWTGGHWSVRAVVVPLLGWVIGFGAHKARFWLNHYPPWVSGLIGAAGAPIIWAIGTFIIARLRAPVKLLKERDEAIEKLRAEKSILEDDRPRLSACLIAGEKRLLLCVSNSGAPADVSAKITIAGDTTSPQSNVAAAWGVADRVRIKSGDQQEITIAAIRYGGPEGNIPCWHVPYFAHGKRWETSLAFTRHPRELRQTVTIRVFSEPESLLQPICCTLTLLAFDEWENLSGVNECD